MKGSHLGALVVGIGVGGGALAAFLAYQVAPQRAPKDARPARSAPAPEPPELVRPPEEDLDDAEDPEDTAEQRAALPHPIPDPGPP